MAKPAPVFRFSPSEHHRVLMDSTQQLYAFKGGGVSAWKRKLKPVVKRLLGDSPEKHVSLKVRSIYRKKHQYGTIEKIVYQSEEGADVPAWVCIPDKAEPPYAWMICLQGHSTGAHNSVGVERDNEQKSIVVEGDRDYAIGCMKRGIAAIAVEQRSFGLRREQKQEHVAQHGCHDATMHALMLGRTLVGERVFDVDRAIDYLYTRKDVNRKKVGVMGNSGGGTVSLFSAAVLPRIQFAIPSCYFCTFRDSIMSIYHCMDNYLPGLLKYAEMSDVMGLFAPKPLVVVAGVKDDIFPIAATRKSFKALKKIYRAAGAADRCHLVEGPEGHRFYADLAWAKMLPEINRIK